MISCIERLTPSQAELVARVLEAILVDISERHGVEVDRLQRRRLLRRQRKSHIRAVPLDPDTELF